MSTTTRVRPSAVAGTFYPARPGELAAVVERCLAPSRVLSATTPEPEPSVKAIVVPHAGYVYSGPIAASAYALLEPARATIQRVLLLGPAHRVPVVGMAVPSVDAFRTPLGDVPIDAELRTRAAALPGVVVDDFPHVHEHSLEVQLPFLQQVLDDFHVLPVAVGAASAASVAELINACWGGPETLIVVSSDLSHYESYHDAAQHDRVTADAVVDGHLTEIGVHDACGAYPLRGLLRATATRGMSARLLDLRSSGDTAGPKDRVVGYGAFAFAASTHTRSSGLTLADERALLDIAIDAIKTALITRRRPRVDSSRPTRALTRPGASFVTLERDGRLLGCIGSLQPSRSLAEDVAHNAVASAFDDPRLPALTVDDFAAMSVKVSVLSPLEPVAARSLRELARTLRPGTDGLLVGAGRRRATLLPSVWPRVADADEFLTVLWQKAGWPPRSWPDGIEIQRYTTDEFADEGPREPPTA